MRPVDRIRPFFTLLRAVAIFKTHYGGFISDIW